MKRLLLVLLLGLTGCTWDNVWCSPDTYTRALYDQGVLSCSNGGRIVVTNTAKESYARCVCPGDPVTPKDGVQ